MSGQVFKLYSAIIVVVMFFVLIIYFTFGSVDHYKGRRVLESQGLKNIELGGWSFFGCSKDDSYRTKFKATGTDGKPISGTLCSGPLRSITVRYD